MYIKLPNIVLGFHGCTQKTFDNVIGHGEEIIESTNGYDWLGHGIYFWEQNYERAKQWAEEVCERRRANDEPAVLGAVIDLGLCLNLSDSGSIELIDEAQKAMLSDFEKADIEPPRNTKFLHRLDCAVIEYLHHDRSVLGCQAFDSVRGFFNEGERLSENSSFFRKSHVQICIRNPNCIKGYFRPKCLTGKWVNP